MLDPSEVIRRCRQVLESYKEHPEPPGGEIYMIANFAWALGMRAQIALVEKDEDDAGEGTDRTAADEDQGA